MQHNLIEEYYKALKAREELSRSIHFLACDSESEGFFVETSSNAGHHLSVTTNQLITRSVTALWDDILAHARLLAQEDVQTAAQLAERDAREILQLVSTG